MQKGSRQTGSLSIGSTQHASAFGAANQAGSFHITGGCSLDSFLDRAGREHIRVIEQPLPNGLCGAWHEASRTIQYDGKPVHYKRMPYDGIYPEAFMHLTTCNQDDSGSRLPDAERSERISWPRPVVEHHPFCEICGYAQCTRPWVWRKNDKNKDRVKIYLPNQQYLVVLGERRDYWVLITAYYVNRQWSIDKLEKEYNSRFSTRIQ